MALWKKLLDAVSFKSQGDRFLNYREISKRNGHTVRIYAMNATVSQVRTTPEGFYEIIPEPVQEGLPEGQEALALPLRITKPQDVATIRGLSPGDRYFANVLGGTVMHLSRI